MSKQSASLTDLAYATQVDKADATRILAEAGITSEPGPSRANLYPTLAAVRALVSAKFSRNRSGLEEARTEDALASARLKRLQAEKLEGNLADVGEILEWQNDIFDRVIATVKKSTMTDAEKEDCLSQIAESARQWEAEKLA